VFLPLRTCANQYDVVVFCAPHVAVETSSSACVNTPYWRCRVGWPHVSGRCVGMCTLPCFGRCVQACARAQQQQRRALSASCVRCLSCLNGRVCICVWHGFEDAAHAF
jgi:hypothetical protein